MSTQSPLAPLADLIAPPVTATYANSSNSSAATDSYSSATLEGQLAVLQRELYWQALAEAAMTSSSAVVTTMSVPTDPLIQYAWHLVNSGQQVGNPDFQNIFGTAGIDLNVAPVWNRGYTGAGVTVSVIDTGVETLHPDLRANISTTIPGLDPLGLDNDANPRPDLFDPVVAHGTAVAGIIGAVANNGIGSAGVAPGVSMVPIRLIDQFGGLGLGQPAVEAFRYRIQDIDITNNSWGPGVIRGLGGPTAAELLALRDSVIFGRGGLGQIHVFSSGNSGGAYDSSSYNGFASSRYTIGVTAFDHDGTYNNLDGTVTSYPEIGASILVAAPTGSNSVFVGFDGGVGSGIYTTDLTGTTDSGLGGFNTPAIPSGQELDRDFLDDGVIPNSADYTSRFNGTSAAAPMVTGVIALMLEANPNLTWRDVQEILVRSARQVGQFDVPQIGQDTGGPVEFSQNLWIHNQKPVFHDPDEWVANIPIDPFLRQFFPTLDPNITSTSGILLGGMHYQPTPIGLTNSAGYTVSQGRGAYGELTGYAHGAVDAEMAVQLAEQWTEKGQSLADELTFTTFASRIPARGPDGTNLPAREIGNMDTGRILVPGGLGGEKGFIDFWNEYYEDDPEFGGNEPENTRGTPIYFTVPDTNAMTIESMEVIVNISGGTAAALSDLRILLVSPDGTHSELNNSYIEPGTFSLQNGSPYDLIFDAPSVDNGGPLVWSFSSKRSWGERSSDALAINPLTQEPIVNTTGFATNRGILPLFVTETLNTAIKQGWQIHFENYGGTDLNLDGLEIVWHGSPIVAGSQRVQGFVGIDEDGDDAFNYGRTIAANVDIDGDGLFTRYSEINNVVDLEQEQFAGNVTVTVTRTSDGSLVDQFVTGHDGNYFFDLVPDDYTISIDDPLDREAKDDATTDGQFLRHFKKEWQITADWFRAWDHDAVNTSEVLVNANGTPLNWVDGNGNATAAGAKNINFLLDPGIAALPQAKFDGAVYADVNGDGAYNGDDVYLPNITVFGDVNRNGVKDSAEPSVLTDANGNYSLIVPITQSSVVNVGVSAPVGWTATKPVSTADPNASIFTRFADLGDEFDLPNFALKPPTTNGSGSLPGFLLGVVYNDKLGAGAGSRQAGEMGAGNMTVYLDANNNGSLDLTETKTTTNNNGAYVFSNVTPGQKVVRIVATSPVVQTAPNPGLGRTVTLAGSSTITNIQFGVRNTAILDFGDLPLDYGMTLSSQDGARHSVGGYYLGAPNTNDVDAELDGQPSLNADGDDLAAPAMDEDGITFGALSPGATVELIVQASQSGYLNGWIDWNDDNDFNDVGERVLTDVALKAGSKTVAITVPASANAAKVYARFRFGAPGLGLTGAASYGEVEDYRLDVALPALPPIVGMQADANSDGYVDGDDILAWQRNLGRTSGATRAQGDANGDQAVNAQDLAIIRGDFGDGASTAAAVTLPNTADFNNDGAVDGDDLLSLQRGLGLAHPTVGAGDANRDGAINGADFAIWRQLFGQQSENSSIVASAAASTAAVAASSPSGGQAIAPSVVDAALTESNEVSAPAAVASVRAAFSGRAFVSHADGESQVRRGVASPALRGSYRPVAQTVASLGDVQELLADDDFRRDRAFDDLLGSRRRQGLLAVVDADVDGDEMDCDAAFAAFAEHFDWTAE